MLDKSPPTGHPHGIVPERSPPKPRSPSSSSSPPAAPVRTKPARTTRPRPPVADAAPDFPDAAPDDGSPDRPGSPAEPTDARRPTADAAPDAEMPRALRRAWTRAPRHRTPRARPPLRRTRRPGPAPERRPIVFVHGINGSHADFDVMVGRFVDAGWPRDWLVALDYPDPAWGCNADNGAFLDQTVERLRRDTGARTVDVIAHSMGALSSRYYLQRLGRARGRRPLRHAGGPAPRQPVVVPQSPAGLCLAGAVSDQPVPVGHQRRRGRAGHPRGRVHLFQLR
jgi:hypothetical protein